MTQHKLPELRYPENALEPHISAETLAYHYGKHRQFPVHLDAPQYFATLQQVAAAGYRGFNIEPLSVDAARHSEA